MLRISLLTSLEETGEKAVDEVISVEDDLPESADRRQLPVDLRVVVERRGNDQHGRFEQDPVQHLRRQRRDLRHYYGQKLKYYSLYLIQIRQLLKLMSVKFTLQFYRTTMRLVGRPNNNNINSISRA